MKIRNLVKVTKSSSFGKHIYDMDDYKLASVPRIIGVMRARLTDNTLMESRRISTLRTAITSKTASCYVRSLHLLDERRMYRGWNHGPSIDSRFNFEKVNSSFLEEFPYRCRNLNSIFVSLIIYLRKGQTACFPAVFGREEIARTRAIKQVKC